MKSAVVPRFIRRRIPLPAVFLVVLLASLASSISTASASPTAPPPRALLLNSYHHGNQFSDQEMEGIRSVLPPDTEYSVEFMDSKRISGSPAYLGLLQRMYLLKYRDKRFDVIISTDDDAFQFLLKYHGQLFPATPVVFCGVNRFEPSMVADKPLFTGVVETIDFRGTIELALRLHPDTRTIFVLNDNTTSGRIDRANFEAAARSGRFAVDFQFLNSDAGISLAELLARLRTLPPHSLVDYINFYQDITGEVLNSDRVLPEISKAAAAPIYTQIGSFLGYGVVGGKLNSGAVQGETAARIALRIMEGEPASRIPVQTGATRYMFDQKQLRRWGIALG